MPSISGHVRHFSTLIMFVAVFVCDPADAQALVHFDLPAQPLAQTLKAIGTATNTDVGFSARQVAGLLAPPLKADLTVDGALMRVLAGTGLRPQHLDDHTIVIAVAEASASDVTKKAFLLANMAGPAEFGVQLTAPAGPEQSNPPGKQPSSDGRKQDLDEIVVTGSHIRGVTSTASPTQIYTREDIDRTGLGTVASFVESLPQNFGSASENTIATVAGNAATADSTGATGVNLRGLGNDATLVLVNGRRVAPGGIDGNVADISLIPLAAVERIEVVTDGASAIYGSDAVGGVINFILRQNYDGADTRARFGSVTDGSSHEIQIGQTVGKTWRGGSAVGSYEYYDRTPLSGSDRSASRDALQPFSLLPEQLRQSAFGSLRESLADGVVLFADGTFAHRSTYFDVSSPGLSERSPTDITSYSLDVGNQIHLPGDSALEISASYANNRNLAQTFDNLLQSTTLRQDIKSAVLSLDAKIDGAFGNTFTGPISYAIGSQFRKESYNFRQYDYSPDTPTSESQFEPDRNILAAFLELRIPVLQGRSGSDGASRLEISLADRFEHYSDFGSTNNPQIGVLWRPSPSIKIRGTAGTSFKAPSLYALNPIPYAVFPAPLPDSGLGSNPCSIYIGGSGNTCTNTLVDFGSNQNLGPEKARTWTIGLDIQPENLPGLRLNATYYSLRFTNRITNPSSILTYIYALQNESALGPSIVHRNPSPALLQQFASFPAYSNFFGIDLSSVGAFVDYRLQNLATERTNGIDLDVAYKENIFSGELETGISATYVLKLNNQFTAATPPIDNLNTPYNPIDLRMRGRMEYQRGSFSSSIFLNYTNSYSDNRAEGIPIPVASWITVDANFGYQIDGLLGITKQSKLMLGVTNIANREPPYLSNPAWGVNFDGTNANALGRFVYLQVSTQW